MTAPTIGEEKNDESTESNELVPTDSANDITTAAVSDEEEMVGAEVPDLIDGKTGDAAYNITTAGTLYFESSLGSSHDCSCSCCGCSISFSFVFYYATISSPVPSNSITTDWY